MDIGIGVLLGKTLESVKREDYEDGEVIYFVTTEGDEYKMYHYQDCCESVFIEDICGDLEWLIGEPILRAEERGNHEENIGECESETWTFYEIATIKGAVTIRWYGTSNGYYSEKVDFEKC